MSQFSIKKLEEKDLDTLVELCAKHASYEKATFSYENKKQNLKKFLFAKQPALFCLVIEYESEIIGYTTYMKQFSTWDANFYLYMDCLFIEEEYRSLGIGKEVLNRLKKEAKELNCTLIQWQTPTFNTKAIKFYKNNNATSKIKERFFLKT